MKDTSMGKLIVWVIAIICVVLAIYYYIPGIHHVFATPSTGTHLKHSILFIVLAIVDIAFGRILLNSNSSDNTGNTNP